MIRSADLTQSMSRYLIRCIEEMGNITLHTHTEIVEFAGNDYLEQVTFRNLTREVAAHAIEHSLFEIIART